VVEKALEEAIRRREEEELIKTLEELRTVISVRIRKELKRKARELGIDVREVVEKALEEAIRRREEEELIKTLEELRSLFSCISEKEWVDAVRKSRNER
jgi:post-segregation antitoxin (ccd killing protein)